MQDYTILVNKEHLLSSDYVPENLVITDNNENIIFIITKMLV